MRGKKSEDCYAKSTTCGRVERARGWGAVGVKSYKIDQRSLNLSSKLDISVDASFLCAAKIHIVLHEPVH